MGDPIASAVVVARMPEKCTPLGAVAENPYRPPSRDLDVKSDFYGGVSSKAHSSRDFSKAPV